MEMDGSDAMVGAVDRYQEGQNQEQRCVQRHAMTIDDLVHPEDDWAIDRGRGDG
jgi:hypothetical protein